METSLLVRACAAIAVFGFVACGDSSGSGGGDVSGDPGREVDGCFDCTESEYCLILDTDGTQKNHCAEAACGIDCDCTVDDAQGRLEACQNYSCQEGSGLLYCYE